MNGPEAFRRSVESLVANLRVEEPLFKCHLCRDTAYVNGKPIQKYGHVYATCRPCTCQAGKAISQGIVRREEEKRSGKSSSRRRPAKRDREYMLDDDDIPF